MKAVLTLLGCLLAPVLACAEYTPLIGASTFTGIQTDATAAAAGIVSVCLIIAGLGLIVRMFTR
jgi:hypothetical protein